jgi:hypothetical protein
MRLFSQGEKERVSTAHFTNGRQKAAAPSGAMPTGQTAEPPTQQNKKTNVSDFENAAAHRDQTRKDQVVMKKVISALSSLVIAATALGGTCVVNTTAATNGTVDNTIIDIQTTEGKAHEIQANAGDKIPFDIYIPQSNGFNTLSLLFSINGDTTKGQDPALCDGATSYTLKKDTKLGKAGETITHPELFGNYGIKMSKDKSAYASPNCLYSGYLNMNPVNAGNPMRDGYAYVTPEFYTLMLVCNSYQLKKKDADAYGAWIKAGGNKNWEDEYDDYTPVSTWTDDESWAYDSALFHSELELPANLPDGTYVFDVYTGNYVGSQFLEDFNAVNADAPSRRTTRANSSRIRTTVFRFILSPPFPASAVKRPSRPSL